MNTINSILPPLLQNTIVQKTNRYVNVDNKDRPVVKKIIDGFPQDVYLNDNNSYTGLKDNVEYWPEYKLDAVTVTAPRVDTSSWLYKLRKRLYNNIYPEDYWDADQRVYDALLNRNPNRKSSTDLREAAWGMYLGLLDKDMRVSKYDHFEPSPYRPSVGKPVGKVYKLKNYNPLDDRMLYEALMNPNKNFVADDYGSSFIMGNYTIGKGQDENGKYISYYDDWDLSPHSVAGSDESKGVGKPFTLYDRRYYTDAEAKAILDLYKGSTLEWLPGYQPKPVR